MSRSYESELLEAVFLLNPRTGERARRLVCAVRLLKGGATRRDAAAQIQQRFAVGQPEAWRVVDMAADIVITAADGEVRARVAEPLGPASDSKVQARVSDPQSLTGPVPRRGPE